MCACPRPFRLEPTKNSLLFIGNGGRVEEYQPMKQIIVKYFLAQYLLSSFFSSPTIILGVRNELETKGWRDVCDNVVVVFG